MTQLFQATRANLARSYGTAYVGPSANMACASRRVCSAANALFSTLMGSSPESSVER
ncbi:CxxC motif-containing protein (DUF1111 family) [Paraburkholderia sp. MM5482-R2]